MEDTKHCPYCDEIIKINAIKCKHCGSLLTDTKVPTDEITPEAQVKSALGSKYEIIEELGRGGMATVYKALQKNLNRLVALKVIHKNLINYRDKEFLERFRREAQLSASLNHPNIVTIYDVGSEGLVNYIAMEYLEGNDLHHIIRNKGKLSVQETIDIIAPIAEALDYAHNKGIVHRDIKSSNIIITSNGRAALTDFGIAHAATDTKLTQTGMVIGTPEYMSPEQAISGQVDAQSDLYSLGVVLYECLTGDVPFRGETPVSTIYKIVNEKAEPLNKTASDAPKWLESIVNKILSKDKKKRFFSGKDFSRALRSKQQVTDIFSSEAETIVITNNDLKKLEKKYHPSRQTVFGLAIGLILFISLAYFLFDFGVLSFLYGNDNPTWDSLSELEKKRVELLLEEGDQLLNNNDLITPPNKNAVERFNEALKIHPGNQHASEKLNQIASILEKEITQLIENKNLAKAKELLVPLSGYFPDNNNFKKSLNLIRIRELEANASGLLDKEPAEAYRICKEIEALDPKNTFITSTFPVIKKNLVSKADKEYEKRNYQEALKQYNNVVTLFEKDKDVEKKIASINSRIAESIHLTVPDLSGYTIQKAEAALSKYGLSKGKVSEIISASQNKGKVINQIPKAGTKTKKGSQVNLIIGK